MTRVVVACGRCGNCAACRLLAGHPERYGPKYDFGNHPTGEPSPLAAATGELPLRDGAVSSWSMDVPAGNIGIAREDTGDCPHGKGLTGFERVSLGLSHRKWKRCSHPERPLGEYVCPCTGCGSKCRGYQS